MKLYNRWLAVVIFTLLMSAIGVRAQESNQPPYIPPEEEDVRATIEKWQDMKFGMFIHWGTYSQWGIVESWSICPRDVKFCNIRPEGMPYFEYLQKYEALKNTFNPIRFNPDRWAAAAEYAGMKYVVFTTKHHDGFNMFDTAYSDYKITDQDCPFSSNPKANIAKEVFNAYRAHGLKAGAYYSIADWHCNDYWWDYFPPTGSGINYSAKARPEKWQALNDFINNQLEELTDGEYGDLDMIWFDLCGPSPEAQVQWDRFAKTIRTNQPGTMMVARHTNSIYENYRTPEQKIPDQALDYPWETCMTMATSWSYKPGDRYKSAFKILSMLVQIVSRGGNYLLNVGPGPDGELDPIAYERLREIGDWMKVNAEGIYETRPVAPFHEGNFSFTQKGDYVYAFYVPGKEGESLPSQLTLSSFEPVTAKAISLLGYGRPLKWKRTEEGIAVSIPSSVIRDCPCEHVWCLRIKTR